jgi:hypothetical protein
MQLLQNVMKVIFDRAYLNTEGSADLPVSGPSADQLQHLLLSIGELAG